jgi:putative ABC transport system permease protein
MIEKSLSPALEAVSRAGRTIRRHPGLALLIIVTAAIGIGSGVGVFTYVDALFFKPLPYRDSGRLVRLSGVQPRIVNIPFSGPDLDDLRARQKSFSGLVAYDNYAKLDVNLNGERFHYLGAAVSPEFFDFLGVHAFRGQVFQSSDGEGEGRPVAILGYNLWRDEFGGSESIIGSPIQINGTAFTVIGVLSRDFWFPGMQEAKLWIPLVRKPFELNGGSMTVRNNHWLKLVARLKPGISLAGAQTEMAKISADLRQQYPDSNGELKWVAEPFRQWINEDTRAALPGLLAICALIIGIACANIAVLVLLKLSTRRAETATQLALGARQFRVYAEEAGHLFVLSLIGGILGGGIGYAIVKAVPIQEGDTAPLLQNLTIDHRVLLAFIGLSVLSSALAGLAAITGIMRDNWTEALRAHGLGTITSSTSRKLQVFVACQIALATILVIGATTLYSNSVKTAAIDPGFQAQHLLSLEFDLSSSQYAKDESRVQLVQTLLDRVRALPGVEAAGVAGYLPFGGLHGNGRFSVVGSENQDGWTGPPAENNSVTPGYFQTMRIPVLAGRDFSADDKPRQVVIVNSRLANMYFHGADAVGRSLKLEGGDGPYRIVGVVGDTKRVALNEASLFYAYLPYQEDPPKSVFLTVRTAADPLALTSAVKAAIRNLDSTMPVFNVMPMESRVMQSLTGVRFNAAFVGSCAALALLLALIGVYSSVSYAISARRFEIGIRMAMGAQISDVVLLLATKTLRLVALGLLLGVVCVPLLRGILIRWTSQTIPINAAALLAVCVITGLVSLTAALVPIWKAAKINPAQALRME